MGLVDGALQALGPTESFGGRGEPQGPGVGVGVGGLGKGVCLVNLSRAATPSNIRQFLERTS